MRVINGRLGGRDIGSVPEGVRPTTDRVRESLFTILGPLNEKRVLDLFAGTGALGLEAYSRGAESITFVERSRKVAKALQARLRALDLDEWGDRVQLMPMEAKKALRILSQKDVAPFDLIFMDPPYEAGDRTGTLEHLFETGLLAERGVVVVEGPKRHPLPPILGARIVDERQYGDTLLTWVEHATHSKKSPQKR
jgi:16S rRNA (guanine966-N2)-methyltransferase